ncbi:hypothetical protein CALVIDRAFT_9739 [Calocera viscosa TUFC12733]|uniref:Uncharacterized protein n=1 Tax=Calocera viscosa (strain TUFC12733) TaxID=1330018 RepID=A0A167S3C0_CALVF|nr:hypothetical protein CALVIDRAFT_9739 [Calocera viscosa TUFC12733]
MVQSKFYPAERLVGASSRFCFWLCRPLSPVCQSGTTRWRSCLTLRRARRTYIPAGITGMCVLRLLLSGTSSGTLQRLRGSDCKLDARNRRRQRARIKAVLQWLDREGRVPGAHSQQGGQRARNIPSGVWQLGRGGAGERCRHRVHRRAWAAGSDQRDGGHGRLRAHMGHGRVLERHELRRGIFLQQTRGAVQYLAHCVQ